jgi:hypothetical protein
MNSIPESVPRRNPAGHIDRNQLAISSELDD